MIVKFGKMKIRKYIENCFVYLMLFIFVPLYFFLSSLREYGTYYGSYRLQYSYYGMIKEENSSQGFRHMNVSLNDIAKIKDKLWFRNNLSDFNFKAPLFVDNRSKDLWYKNGENIGFLKAQPLKDFFTEVLFLRNGTFDADKFCGYKGDKDWITQSRTREVKSWIPSFIYKKWFPVLVPLRNRDGNTFQHFTDGTLHRIVQVLPLLQNRSVRLLMRRPRDSILYDMLRKLRISHHQLVYQIEELPFGADIMIHSCIKDSLHPTLWKEARRLLGVKSILDVPYHKAYVVLVTRDGCHNCGRRILNIDDLTKVLRQRYGDDVVKVFRGSENLESNLELFGHSKIILGPHGGGLYNMNFAPYGTSIIEFMPTKENGDTDIPGHQVFWKVANILYHDYWRVSLPSLENKNMVVDLDILSLLLDSVDKKSISKI